MTSDDAELLRRYVEEKAETAFAELVQRHLAFVYAVALRRVGGDAHLAEDIALGVFTDLARKADSLRRHPALGAWLFRSTRFAAAQAVRAERRRGIRQRETGLMDALAKESGLEPTWKELRPVLDDAIEELPERDRQALWLRFFEGRAFAEVAAKLAVSEDAARVRVNRALEKMRVLLSRHGVTSTSAALGLALANQVEAAVPAGLATSITSAALTGAAASGGAGGWLTFMTMSKIKIAIVGVAFLAGAAGLIVQRRSIVQLQDEVEASRGRGHEFARLRTEKKRFAPAPASDASAVAKAQPDIAGARPAPPAVASLVTGSTGPKPSLATGLKPAADFARGDSSTPKTTLESLYVAVNEGDFAAIENLFVLAPADRERAAAMFARLTEAKRTEFGTPERMVAMLSAGSLQVAGMQVMWEVPGARREFMDSALANDPGYRTLHVQREYPDGRVREEDMVFKQTQDGWRWVLH
jgi:RNA polymerase sigma factor (sigma-70 family)